MTERGSLGDYLGPSISSGIVFYPFSCTTWEGPRIPQRAQADRTRASTVTFASLSCFSSSAPGRPDATTPEPNSGLNGT
jgi:hypothetical protein